MSLSSNNALACVIRLESNDQPLDTGLDVCVPTKAGLRTSHLPGWQAPAPLATPSISISPRNYLEKNTLAGDRGSESPHLTTCDAATELNWLEPGHLGARLESKRISQPTTMLNPAYFILRHPDATLPYGLP
eukprot:scaffold16044_cov67-Phaeocystis_antarctica.AAC.5